MIGLTIGIKKPHYHPNLTTIGDLLSTQSIVLENVITPKQVVVWQAAFNCQIISIGVLKTGSDDDVLVNLLVDDKKVFSSDFVVNKNTLIKKNVNYHKEILLDQKLSVVIYSGNPKNIIIQINLKRF